MQQRFMGDGEEIQSAVPAGPTRWSLVIAAGTGDESVARRAQSELVSIYRRPLIIYALRRGLSPEDAEDAVQSFFSERFLQGRLLGSADRAKGSFRALLRKSLDSFISDLKRGERAQKRGGGWMQVAGDEGLQLLLRQVSPDLGPEAAFDVAWAGELVRAAIDRLRQGSEPSMRLLLDFLEDGAPADRRAALAAELGISLNTLAQRLHQLRYRRLPKVLREEVWQDCDSQEVFRQEWSVFCEITEVPRTCGL